MDEVDQDVDRDATALRLGGHRVELAGAAVDEHNPGAQVVRVTPPRRNPWATAVARSSTTEPARPRPGRFRPVLPLRPGQEQHIRRGARDRDGVTDGRELRDPFPAVLLAGRQPRRQLPARGGGLRGRRAQRFGPHHDALAIELQHQQPLLLGGAGPVLGVVGVHVDRRGGGRPRPVAAYRPGPRSPAPPRPRCRRTTRGHETGQPVRVQPGGQVQLGVNGVEVRHSPAVVFGVCAGLRRRPGSR